MDRRTYLAYFEIADHEVRIGMRAGEILLTSAIDNPLFRRELERKAIPQRDFLAVDGNDLFLERVVGKLQEVGGHGAVIRVIGLALESIGSLGVLASDREAVIMTLTILQERLRKEYKASKKGNRYIP